MVQQYVSGEDTEILSRENIELEIKDITIKSPSGLAIIKEYTSELIVVNLDVEYDLRKWREAIEGNFDQINIYGWVHLQVSYKIMGEDIKENIFENVKVNFILPTAFFLE